MYIYFYFLVIYFNDCTYSLEELNKILSLKPNFRKVGADYIRYFYTWVLFLSIFCCFNSVLIITWSTVSNSKTFKAFNGVLMSILRQFALNLVLQVSEYKALDHPRKTVLLRVSTHELLQRKYIQFLYHFFIDQDL